MQVFTRVRRVDMSFRDVTKKSQIEGRTRDVADVTHQKCGLRFEKSQLVESCRPKKKGDFRLLAEAFWRVPRVVEWTDEKVSIERWYLSPYVEKPLNSKVIKSFVPELRSCKCFSCFGIPMLYIWVMNIQCIFHIFMYGYVTNIGREFCSF